MIGGPLRTARFGLAFLTRVPGPPEAPTDRELGASTRAWPLAGLVVGAACAAGLTLGAWGVSPGFGAVVAVSAGAWVTRGFHLDGLSDCFDGMLCPGDRDRRLAVMHDPHLGALAGVMTALWLLAKVALVAACVERGTALGALVGASVVGRIPLAAEVWLGRPAADRGLFATLHRLVGRADAGVAVAVGLVALVPAALLVPPPALGAAILGAAVATAVWHRGWVARIGGLNGDVLGAAVELRELCVLCALASPLLT